MPPTNTSGTAAAAQPCGSPRSISRKAMKVRKAVRVLESMTSIRQIAAKPRRSRMPQPALLRAAAREERPAGARPDPRRGAEREECRSGDESPEREQVALAEALGDEARGNLEGGHRGAVGAANQADLRERQAEALREQRQQHVGEVGETVVQGVRRAAGGERALLFRDGHVTIVTGPRARLPAPWRHCSTSGISRPRSSLPREWCAQWTACRGTSRRARPSRWSANRAAASRYPRSA